ncbi:MAG: methylmalonyl Co-A mutase-associated GTPase MeaB [Acidimicrobiales bacterium]
MSLRDATVGELFDRAKSGERRALGRLLTHIERGRTAADEVAELTHPLSGSTHVVGLTGAPGSGKSTLTGRLGSTFHARGGRVGIVAIDPSSPITGGAILGDRIRMDEVVDRETTFIRSMATRGHSGGLALAVPGAIRVLDAVGYDPVIVETVGVGQVEVDIAGAADTTVIVVTPGWGDAVQANKAGLLEVGDVFVVNKADRAGAADARRDLDLMLDLTDLGDWRPPVVMTTATDGEGLDALADAIEAHRDHLATSGELQTRRAARLHGELRSHMHRIVQNFADRRLDAAERHRDAVVARDLSPAAAARRVLADVNDLPSDIYDEPTDSAEQDQR